MKSANRCGYTLVEVLAVIGIMIAVLSLTIPTVGNIRSSAWLNEAAEIVSQQFLVARQQAIGKGMVAEVRFLEKDNRWFGVQTVIYLQGGAVEPLTAVAKFPEGVAIEVSERLSPFLNSLNSETTTLNQYGAVNWRGLRFTPSGEATGPESAPALSADRAFLTIVLNHDLSASRPAGGAPPSNYATVQVTPATGRVTVYRP